MNLNQVTLPVSNLPDAVLFYLKMGFTQIVDSPHYARLSCPKGNSTFSLMLNEDVFNNGAVIYFETEDNQLLDDWIDLLKSRGLKFEQLPIDQSYLWRETILRDPSGNKIKLYCAGVNRLQPPWQVNINFGEKQ